MLSCAAKGSVEIIVNWLSSILRLGWLDCFISIGASPVKAGACACVYLQLKVSPDKFTFLPLGRPTFKDQDLRMPFELLRGSGEFENFILRSLPAVTRICQRFLPIKFVYQTNSLANSIPIDLRNLLLYPTFYEYQTKYSLDYV